MFSLNLLKAFFFFLQNGSKTSYYFENLMESNMRQISEVKYFGSLR